MIYVGKRFLLWTNYINFLLQTWLWRAVTRLGGYDKVCVVFSWTYLLKWSYHSHMHKLVGAICHRTYRRPFKHFLLYPFLTFRLFTFFYSWLLGWHVVDTYYALWASLQLKILLCFLYKSSWRRHFQKYENWDKMMLWNGKILIICALQYLPGN